MRVDFWYVAWTLLESLAKQNTPRTNLQIKQIFIGAYYQKNKTALVTLNANTLLRFYT